MDPIEHAATISIGRATGFGALAIFCVVFAFAFDPVIATRAGAILCIAMAALLGHFAMLAPLRSYRRTELWLILPKADRPPAAVAQRLIGEALRRAYLRFAEASLLLATIFAGLSVLFGLFLPGPELPQG